MDFFNLNGQPFDDKMTVCALVFITAIANYGDNFGVPACSAEQNRAVASDFINVCYCNDVCVEVTMMQKNLNRIKEIGCLKDNWNNNGADAFNTKILDKASNFIAMLQKQPQVYPTARDSIQFEYENERGDYLEFEMFDRNKLSMYFCSANDEEVNKEVAVEEVNGIVRDFYESKLC